MFSHTPIGICSCIVLVLTNAKLLSMGCERGYRFEVKEEDGFYYIGTCKCRVTGKYKKIHNLFKGCTNLSTCLKCEERKSNE